MALERITVNTPKGFQPDNQSHVQRMLSFIAQEKGSGWEVQSYNPSTGMLSLVRGAAITEVKASVQDAKRVEVSIGRDVKPSDGEKIAQRFEAMDDYKGMYLSEFKPHVGRAVLTRMNEQEVRCRDAVANVIGVPRWEVQVEQRADDGFKFVLPPRYAPAKHFDKLQEVAENVVGEFGWYARINPQTLHGDFIPSDPPTFEPVYHFDFSTLPDDPRTLTDDELLKLPIGVALADSGEQNMPIELDFSDSVGALVVGLAGSGKSVTVQSIIFSAKARGWDLALINTVDKATDFVWAKPFVKDNFWGCDSVAQSVAVAKLVQEEGEKRGVLLSKHGVSKWQDLPADVKRKHPPLLLVADELASLLTADPLPSGLSKEMKELPEFMQMQQDLLESKLLATALSTLPAVYRAAGIRVIYLTQQPNQNYGFSTKLKGNLPHRVMLGTSPSQAEKGHAFRTPEKVPDVPTHIAKDGRIGRGVGLAHLDGSEPTVFKGYFASLEDYLAEADRRRFPRSSRPEPSPSQVRALVPSLLDGEDGGGMGVPAQQPGKGEGFRGADIQYEPWQLGEDGKPLTGFELANAARHHATVEAKKADAGG